MSSQGLQRMSFKFERDSEVRYMAGVPKVGDHVTRGDELWTVSAVDNHRDEPVIVCARSAAPHAANGGG